MENKRVIEGFLVVNVNGEMRTVKRLTRGLSWDEVAFPIEVTLPSAYGKVYEDKTIKLDLPNGGVELAVGDLIDIASQNKPD